MSVTKRAKQARGGDRSCHSQTNGKKPLFLDHGVAKNLTAGSIPATGFNVFALVELGLALFKTFENSIAPCQNSQRRD